MWIDKAILYALLIAISFGVGVFHGEFYQARVALQTIAASEKRIAEFTCPMPTDPLPQPAPWKEFEKLPAPGKARK